MLCDDRLAVLCQLIKRWDEDPGQLIFHCVPQVLDWTMRRTVGRAEQTDDIFRDGQRFRFMTAPNICDDHIQYGQMLLDKLIQKDMKVDGVQVGLLQKKAPTSSRFNRTVHVKVLKAILRCS